MTIYILKHQMPYEEMIENIASFDSESRAIEYRDNLVSHYGERGFYYQSKKDFDIEEIDFNPNFECRLEMYK